MGAFFEGELSNGVVRAPLMGRRGLDFVAFESYIGLGAPSGILYCLETQ